MIKSESIKEIARALSDLQGEIHDAQIDSENPHFKSEYASLESYLLSSRTMLKKHGLSVTQGAHGDNLETALLHISGEFIIFEMPLINEKKSMQGLGSAISYARRYSLGALLGIGESDDDGEKARKEKEEQDAKKAAELRAREKSGAGSGNRDREAESVKQRPQTSAQNQRANEQTAQSLSPKSKIRDETPITFSMTVELDQKIILTGRDQTKTYELICKKYNVTEMMRLKTWQFDEVMELLKKPA